VVLDQSLQQLVELLALRRRKRLEERLVGGVEARVEVPQGV
jgi:hypothetical protein